MNDKLMSEYAIFCSEEQTKLAFKLGAKINEHPFHASVIKGNEKLFENIVCIDDKYYCIPTAEQMIGWLEDKDVVIDVFSHYIYTDEYEKSIYDYSWMRNDEYSDDINYETRKEATIAAIDAALEYLKENKK